ncbi:putative olfactory receptor 2B3 [Ambystoma mexicanum]|uniref:putative olfactory receptor 2B3 n=1 Tax=Ambystoma mexicanum TaxID=8296 RepID=UPI0037E75A28
MEKWNGSAVTEFILLGLSDKPQVKVALFVIFLVIYLIILSGNIILITVCILEPRLHSPMYFFLVNLAVLDIMYASVSLPNMLPHLLMHTWTISFSGCAAQIFTYLFLAITENFILSIIAFDRYVAICFPLHYSNLMNVPICMKMVSASWLAGLLLSVAPVVMVLQLPLCGQNVINHFFCEPTTLTKLACVDTFPIQIMTVSSGIFVLLLPVAVIIISYIFILSAIMRIRTTEGRSKAFSTCASHLINVTIIYGTSIFIYMKPVPKNSDNKEKMVAVFYTVGPPMWNPFIYSLRNKEMKIALQSLMKKRLVH